MIYDQWPSLSQLLYPGEVVYGASGGGVGGGGNGGDGIFLSPRIEFAYLAQQQDMSGFNYGHLLANVNSFSVDKDYIEALEELNKEFPGVRAFGL